MNLARLFSFTSTPRRSPHALARRGLRALVISFLVPACSEAPALSIADVSFTRSDLLGLSETQSELLSMIAALGVATSRGDQARIGGPLIARGREDLLLERLRQEVTLELGGVTDLALAARYTQSPDYELTVRHLVILSERWRSIGERETARRRAEAALVRARAGEPFAELAGDVSEEPGASARGGLLEPGREGSWVSEFWVAASRLQVGEISGIVESEYGFHVLKLDDRRSIPFPEARDRVVATVAGQLDDPERWRQQVAEWADALTDPSSQVSGVEEDERVRGILLTEADRRNLRVSGPNEARIAREWEFQVTAWGAVLGYEPGMTADEIRTQALLALGSTDQNARIVRDEIRKWGAAFLAAYPVSTPGR